ncbi:hypothetical protein [Dapis sp. BLCC M229]
MEIKMSQDEQELLKVNKQCYLGVFILSKSIKILGSPVDVVI